MEISSYLFLILLNIRCILTFNLDFRIPIVKRGDKDTYFGYSIAQHQTVNEITNEIENWLLVGAPLGQNLQPNTTRSGALFKCPVTTRSEDCVQVVTDGKRDPVDGQYDPSVNSSHLTAPYGDELKDNQWLGVTVRSQGRGGKVMVCAHRYVKRGADYRWGQGMCYTLSQYLDYDNIWEPCKGRPTNKAHEQFGYCQAGTSGVLLEDDTAVIGTPGPYTWRGTMFVMNISSEFLTRDKTFYYSPLLEPGAPPAEVSPVDKYSYLGMSVSAGRFLSDNETQYAAGAPRANGTGQVVIFSKRRGHNPMTVRLVLPGFQFASSFGYELAAADIDGDGRTDLAVGAPFYFTRDRGGAVYIYRRLDESCSRCNEPQVLTGLPESRYGFALTNLGDLNKDRYEDIAVGAPYEGAGAVYIYLGSEKGLITEPSQVIHASELPVGPLDTFGYSLSGGLDLDNNSYPDLLAGAYQQDAVVLLRARPIMDISTDVHPKPSITNIDPTRRGCYRFPSSNYTCFTFEACCSLDPLVEVRGRGHEFILNYTLEAETFQPERKFSRVWFLSGTGSGSADHEARPHIVRRSLTLNTRRNNKKHCEEETVFLKEGIQDIQSPIKFRLTYRLVQREPSFPRSGSPLPLIDNFPILNQQEAVKTFEATFQKDCGENDICESHLFLVPSLLLPHSRRPNASELVLGSQNNVTLNVTAYNLNESAYEAQLFITHPPSLNYTHYKSQNQQLTCKPTNATMVSCSLGNPLKRGASNNFLIYFDPRDIRDEESHLNIRLFANSTSEELQPQGELQLNLEVIRRAEMSLTSLSVPDRLLYGGEMVGESVVRSQEQAGSRVLHIYKLYNQGPWVARGVEVRVEWPHQVGNNKPLGKWLLYLAELPQLDVEGGGHCNIDESAVNPLHLLPESEVSPEDHDSTPPHSNRVRRDIEMVISPETYTDKEGRQHQVVSMNCVQGTAKCIVFSCFVRELGPKKEATITIVSRLWNSTLVEDYPRVDAVHIWSRARLHLPLIPVLQQNSSDDIAETQTVALPDRLDVHEPEDVPLWIIVVSVLAGLLLLVLLVLLLWKFGFFKRRRPDPTLSGNLEKHRDENGDYS